jgi:hypothetical protein
MTTPSSPKTQEEVVTEPNNINQSYSSTEKKKDYKQLRREKNPERKRHGARNENRHKLFVKWLLDKFPELEKQQSASNNQNQKHILDVAGGKGEVAARLTMCHRQKVVMVDPRPADIASCFENFVLPKIPNKWQARLESRKADNPNFVKDTVNERFRQIVSLFDDHTLETSEELQQAVQNASVLLGVHADGATEAIVTAALRFNKPFVVVPCCVFPNLFTERRVEEDDGRVVPVRSHDQFCKFLKAKDPTRFVMETLPFEGRNVAIWWDGKGNEERLETASNEEANR